MGCVPSQPEAQISTTPKSVTIVANHDEDEKRLRDVEISAQQEQARRQDEEKVKLLLLGTGESGKSTIFKQMRILYGSPKTDDDLRMYGVIVRSNIVTAVRKICLLTRQLGYEKKLDEESAAATAADLQDVSGMTPRESYDQIVAYLVDNTANEPFPDIPKEQADQDWVGRSTRAGIQANLDAQQFLQHVEAIRVLWQVRTLLLLLLFVFVFLCLCLIRTYGRNVTLLLKFGSIHIFAHLFLFPSPQ